MINGFCMDYNWSYFIQQLQLFKQEFGHYNIPDILPNNQPLANWVRLIRAKNMLGSLTEAQFIELDELGFVWTNQNRKWVQNTFDLQTFYKKHGHFEVPSKHGRLRPWLSTIKHRYKNKTLIKECIEVLKMIGFPIQEWEV